MMNDMKLRSTGMKALIDNLGVAEAGRFVYLLKNEHFDYTEWRQNRYEGMTIEEISDLAAKRSEKPFENSVFSQSHEPELAAQ